MTVDADKALDALGDPTRRRIISMIGDRGPSTATGLATDLAISRQAVAKHLDLLHAAGITSIERVGREARHHLVPQQLAEASAWLDDRARAWDRRLGALRTEVERRAARRPAE
ncbi:MAG: ArsR/SmtB family transcription factor [Acidimicrobiales bacterium]